MNKLIATLAVSLFAATAFAQTNATPPTQPAAGTTASTTMKKDAMASDTPTTDAKAKRTAKSKARKAKRDEKVGDKPLN